MKKTKLNKFFENISDRMPMSRFREDFLGRRERQPICHFDSDRKLTFKSTSSPLYRNERDEIALLYWEYRNLLITQNGGRHGKVECATVTHPIFVSSTMAMFSIDVVAYIIPFGEHKSLNLLVELAVRFWFR